jgi:hypothetical protein
MDRTRYDVLTPEEKLIKYENNRQKALKLKREWQERNRDEYKKAGREYYQKNREKMLATANNAYRIKKELKLRQLSESTPILES